MVTGSVLDVSLVDRLVAAHDAVVHLAGVAGVPRSLADPVGTYRVNTTGTVCVPGTMSATTMTQPPPVALTMPMGFIAVTSLWRLLCRRWTL